MRQLALVRGARTLVETCAAVKSDERLLVVTDVGRPFSVAEAIALAGRARRGSRDDDHHAAGRHGSRAT